MRLQQATQKAKQLAKTAIPEQIASYSVWYDDDYFTYRVATDSEIEAMLDRCFIQPQDIIVTFEC